ncbi:MAG: PH domain-containing protein [Pseudomonadota bacterium]
MDLTEKVVWQVRPSQLINFKTYSRCVMIMLLTIVIKKVWNEMYFFRQYHNDQTIFAIYQYVIIGLIVIPAIRIAWAWIVVSCRQYSMTNQRLSETYGVFSKVTEDLELYRIKDSTIVEPFELRMFGLGNVVLMTSDRSTPVVVLQGVKDVEKVQSMVREYVEIMRTYKGVREVD